MRSADPLGIGQESIANLPFLLSAVIETSECDALPILLAKTEPVGHRQRRGPLKQIANSGTGP